VSENNTIGTYISDKDIYRSAKLFMDKHGDDAISESLKKSAKLLAKGDVQGGEVWNRIANAIGWMQNSEGFNAGSIH